MLSQGNIGLPRRVGSPFQAPITLQPHYSPALACAFGLTHLAAFIVVLLQPLALLSKAALATAVVLSGALAMRRHLLFLGASIVAITLKPDGTFLVRLANSDVEKGELSPGAFVHPQLTVLVFKLSRKRRRVLLLTPDNVDAEGFRRLRVRLRV
ncbi:MAG: protein YgfX [Gammaproteobacteria bacterium]